MTFKPINFSFSFCLHAFGLWLFGSKDLRRTLTAVWWPLVRPHLRLRIEKGLSGVKDQSLRVQLTFRKCRSDWSDRIPDAIDIVSPGTSLAISALARLAIFPITIQVASCGTPTTILDSEEDLFP